MPRIRTQILVLIMAFAFWLLPGYSDTTNITTAAELSEIQRRGYLIVAVKDNFPPLGFTDASGKLQGLEIDLAKALATELLGSPEAIKLQPVANRDRLPQVLDHKVDLAIARVTATEPRARLVSFSIPYYFDGTRLITKDSSVQKLTDLGQKKNSRSQPLQHHCHSQVLPTTSKIGGGRFLSTSAIAPRKQSCDRLCCRQQRPDWLGATIPPVSTAGVKTINRTFICSYAKRIAVRATTAPDK